MATANKEKAAQASKEMVRAIDSIPEEVIKGSTWDEETLRGVTTFQQAMELASQEYGPVVTADQELGDGFTVLSTEQKRLLVGRPMMVMEWSFYNGDQGKFVAMRCMVQNADGGFSRYIINDGSTGIADQLARYTQRTGKMGALLVKRGLRASDYTYTDPATGEQRPATTFYLDTSA